MRAAAVFGLGFGDEGKGRVVDHLCSIPGSKPLVIRFSGGHQAAHQVVMEDGRRHVFAHFGSGSFREAPTFWSKYCPVNPTALLNEYEVLQSRRVNPVLRIAPQCPITTPFDIEWNKQSFARHHGSCGVGILATHRRERAGYHLWFEDLFHPRVVEMKLSAFNHHADYSSLKVEDDVIQHFLHDCAELIQTPGIERCDDLECFIHEFDRYREGQPIFEGSQGLLLDQNYGFMPHCTPSNTGSKNVLEMGHTPSVWLVTRAYHTRHGNGPMGAGHPHDIKPNPWEVNDDNGMQGKFRTGVLDLDLIRYVLAKDSYIRTAPKTLVITCMDLVEDSWCLVDNGHYVRHQQERPFVEAIANAVDMRGGPVYLSRGAYGSLEYVHLV